MERTWIRKIGIVLEMVKVQHTLFTLPFVLLSASLAFQSGLIPQSGLKPQSYVQWGVVGWILVALVSARCAAMAFNRLVDASFDACNPRTKDRALPRRWVSPRFVLGFILLMVFLFEFSAYRLNPLCFLLSPLALLIILGYSYTKRFTFLSHFILGLALAGAPVGAWIAIRGRVDWVPVLVGVGVLLWVSGFDLLYALQDLAFDCESGLYSLPKKIGVEKALKLSRLLHLFCILVFSSLLWAMPPLKWGYGGACLMGLGLVFYEHRLVRPGDLSKVNVAFFQINALISMMLCLGCLFDVYIR